MGDIASARAGWTQGKRNRNGQTRPEQSGFSSRRFGINDAAGTIAAGETGYAIAGREADGE